MRVFGSIYHQLIWLVKGIKVFALVGKSGTGKSFRAMLLAQKYRIELIVDDGLLIRNQKIIAGKSAKREKTYLGAIKTALFTQGQHRSEVMAVLKRQKFKRILIIGTSRGMIIKITKQLDLPLPSRIILIQDIATEEDIKYAIHSRKKEGKHVIPVPAIEVKRNYPQAIYETIKIFLKRSFFRSRKQKVFEKTVVRQGLTSKGSVKISESALSQMVLHCVSEFDNSLVIERVVVKEKNEKYNLDIYINVPFGVELSTYINELQQYILHNIETFTGMMLNAVNIIISQVTKKKIN